MLIHIHPPSLELLQDGKVAHHIMTTALALQHRHLQTFQQPPFSREGAAIMPIAGKLVRITTPTLPTVPVNLVRLAAYSSWLPFLPSQFGLLFGFQKGRQ